MTDLVPAHDSLFPDVPMTKEEATTTDAAIVKSAVELGNLLLLMEEREGWKALKHPTWDAYLKTVAQKTELSRATLYRRMQLCRVNRNLSQNETDRNRRLPKVKANEAAVLCQLPDDRQQEAVLRAQEIADNYEPSGMQAKFHHPGKRLLSHVEQAVREIQKEIEPVVSTTFAPAPEAEDDFVFTPSPLPPPRDTPPAPTPRAERSNVFRAEAPTLPKAKSSATKTGTEKNPEPLCYVSHQKVTENGQTMFHILSFDGETHYTVPFRESYVTGAVGKDPLRKPERIVLQAVRALVHQYRREGFPDTGEEIRALCDAWDDLIEATLKGKTDATE